MGTQEGIALTAVKVRCAARAWWWSLAILFVAFVAAWLAMLLVLNTSLIDDMLPLWGGISKDAVRVIWIGVIALMKAFVFLGIVFGLFLYRWEKNLRAACAKEAK